MSAPKHPEVSVALVGKDGNAYAILGRCLRAMRRAGVSRDEQQAFEDEATAGDYDHLLRTVMSWFEVDPEDEEWEL